MHIKLQVVLDDLRKIYHGVVRALNSVDHVLQCALLYVGATALDYLSSLNFPPGVQESNPFARHSDGTFWLKHALITDGIYSVESVLLSLGLFVAGRFYGRKFGIFLAGLPWLYAAFLHCQAAFENVLIEVPNLYQVTQQDILRHLLGN